MLEIIIIDANSSMKSIGINILIRPNMKTKIIKYDIHIGLELI